MISIEQYKAKFVNPQVGIEDDWEIASAMAVSCIAKLPNIGFLSEQKRISAFGEILGQVHKAVAADEVTSRQGEMAILIAKFSDKTFEKAFDAFERPIRNGSIEHIDPESRSRLTAFLFHIGG